MKDELRIQLGHPFLIFIWSFSMILIGCFIGMHWHPSHIAALWIAASGAVLMALHEIFCGFAWCTLTAWWIGRHHRNIGANGNV